MDGPFGGRPARFCAVGFLWCASSFINPAEYENGTSNETVGFLRGNPDKTTHLEIDTYPWGDIRNSVDLTSYLWGTTNDRPKRQIGRAHV